MEVEVELVRRKSRSRKRKKKPRRVLVASTSHRQGNETVWYHPKTRSYTLVYHPAYGEPQWWRISRKEAMRLKRKWSKRG